MNVKTGKRQVLIRKSADNDFRQRALLITDLNDDRISIDFCTSWLIERSDYYKSYEQTWYNIQQNSDFKEILKIFKQLPPASITEIMNIVAEQDRHQQNIDWKKEAFLDTLAKAIDLKHNKDEGLTIEQRGIIE